MTATIVDYEAQDYEAIKGFFGEFDPIGMPDAVDSADGKSGTGYRGIFPETQTVRPTPVPSGLPSSPTIYGRYSFDYAGVQASGLEALSGAIRNGVVSIAFRLELGADEAWIRGLGGLTLQLRQRMHDVSNESFCMFPEGVTERHGQSGNFAVYVMRTRFMFTN